MVIAYSDNDADDNWHLVVTGFIQGLCFSMYMPARQSWIPSLVAREDLANAIALNNAGLNASRILGPAIAGILIAIPWINVTGVYYLRVIAFGWVLCSLLQIPIQGEVWNERRPGFLEADSVAHCGSSLAGDFIWSLVYTDLASTWTEGRAVWNKGATGVVAQTRDGEESLPFAVRGFDFDNGSEWLNWTLIRYLQARRTPVRLTRSRPYHKDDNAHVEQKNWMWPRQLLGYGRLSDASAVPQLNRLYKEAWGPLHNFFLPSMKLREKWRDGSRWVRRHDRARVVSLQSQDQLHRVG